MLYFVSSSATGENLIENLISAASQYCAILGVALLLFIACVGTGKALRVLLLASQGAIGFDLAVGAAIWAAVILSSPGPIQVGICFSLSVALFIYLFDWSEFTKPSSRDLGLLLLLPILLPYGLEASIPQSHPDPLWYHLPSAFSVEMPQTESQSIAIYQSAYWENLYRFGGLLFPAHSLQDLVSRQILAQWIHLLIGCVGTLLILWAIFVRLGIEERYKPWLILGLAYAAKSYGLLNSAYVAKNEWGVALWFFAGIYASLSAHKRERVIGYLLLGLACSVKNTHFIALLPLLVLQLVRIKSQPLAELRWILVGIGAAILPQMFIRYHATGNPFFPALNFIFNEQALGPTWQTALRSYLRFPGDLSAGTVFRKIAELIPPYLPLTVMIVSPVIPAVFRSLNLGTKQLWIWLLSSSVIFFCVTGDLAEWRVLGVVPILVAAISPLLIAVVLSELKLQWFSKFLLPVFWFATLMSPLPDIDRFRYLVSPNSNLEIARSIPGTKSSEWLRTKFSSGELASGKIVILDDTRIYYFLGLDFERAWDHAALDRDLSTSPATAIQTLRRSGAGYLVLTTQVIDRFYNIEVLREIQRWIAQNPAAQVFQSENEIVVRL